MPSAVQNPFTGVARLVALASALLVSNLSHAQTASAPGAATWPTKPVKLVVAFAPGGPADIIARLLGQRLSEALGQSVVVENKPGAAGSVAPGIIVKTEADGSSWLVTTSSYAVNPAMQRNLPFDPERDLTATIFVASSPNVIVGNPSFKGRVLKDVIAEAQHGKFNYATAGAGTTPHLSAEYLFKVLAKVNVTHIPYQGGGPSANAVMASQVDLGSVALPAVIELVKGGRVQALAVTGAKRDAAIPSVPTVAESGFPGFEDATWVALFAPAKTPADVVRRMNAEVNTILKTPEFQTRLAGLGFEPMGGSTADASAYLKTELVKWARVVRETGAKLD
jgi:tripartite-type tricarboxylate transporter receptor subunit TctC